MSFGGLNDVHLLLGKSLEKTEIFGAQIGLPSLSDMFGLSQQTSTSTLKQRQKIMRYRSWQQSARLEHSKKTFATDFLFLLVIAELLC